MLKERDEMIASIRKQQARYLKKSHNFDIELSKTMEQALTLDTKNGSTLWTDATSKKLEHVTVAFGKEGTNKIPIYAMPHCI